MKSVIIHLFLSCLTFSLSYDVFAGKYTAVVTGVDNRLDMKRDKADWHTGITRRGRNFTALYGAFFVFHSIEGPSVQWETYILSNNEYKKFALNQLSKISLCKEEFKKKYYDPYFEGNSEWIFPDCVMTPGAMNISEKRALNVDAIAHEIMESCPYGVFKIITTVLDKYGVVFGGLVLYLTIEPLIDEKKQLTSTSTGKSKRRKS